MSNIEVGEYIRTHLGTIGKIVRYDEGEEKYYTDNHKMFDETAVYKHSKEIIDVIEVGDYVNGDEVIPVDYDEDENHNYFDILGVYCIEDDYAYTMRLTDINIKTIVTKERFKEMEYRIDE